MVSTQILSSTTVFGIDNSKNIRMISEESRHIVLI